MSIPGAFIEDLLTRVDIVEVVGRYVQLKKTGANFMGLCPFHNERTPSFSVSPSKQFFHCFSCGKGGDAIAFLREHTGMGFMEAVQDLAGSVGMAIPQEDLSPHEREQRNARKQKQATLGELMETAAHAYRQQLRAHPHAIQYLKDRGVTGEIARRYGLGYAPASGKYLASVFPEYESPLLLENGLVIAAEEDGRRYDRFRDRVMFPIRDVKGQCIGFGGRVLGDAKPKYLNSPETPLFHKGRELYGLFEARTAVREAGYALVTEGYMDVVALAQLGFPNAVATLGTACTPEHVHKLLRFTDAVVFSFDGDAAGRRAARKALDAVLPHAGDTRRISFLFLPTEHDPDSYIRAHGSDAFARLVHAAMPLNSFLLETASQDCDLGTAQGRARLSSQARPLWQQLPPGTFKRLVLGELADKIQLSAPELEEVWIHAQQREAHLRSASPAAAMPGSAAAPDAHHRGTRPPFAPDSATAASPASAGMPGPRSGAARRGGGAASSHAAASSGWADYGGGTVGTAGFSRGRGSVATGPNQAMRLLLWNMQFMEHLDTDDLDTLAHLPAPHGPLFAWLEQQYHESGPQTWAVLHHRLASTEHATFVARLMRDAQLPSEQESEAASWRELRRILAPMLVARLNALLAEVAGNYASDPHAAQRYRALQERRSRLEALRLRGE